MMANLNTELRRKIHSFTTAKGSVYTALPDLTFQRFKTAEGTIEEPFPVTVFIAPHEVLVNAGRCYKALPRIVGRDQDETSDKIEGLIYHSELAQAVCDNRGKRIMTVKDLMPHSVVYICLMREGETPLHIPAYTEVKTGCSVYESSHTHHHLGNTVVRINQRQSLKS